MSSAKMPQLNETQMATLISISSMTATEVNFTFGTQNLNTAPLIEHISKLFLFEQCAVFQKKCKSIIQRMVLPKQNFWENFVWMMFMRRKMQSGIDCFTLSIWIDQVSYKRWKALLVSFSICNRLVFFSGAIDSYEYLLMMITIGSGDARIQTKYVTRVCNPDNDEFLMREDFINTTLVLLGFTDESQDQVEETRKQNARKSFTQVWDANFNNQAKVSVEDFVTMYLSNAEMKGAAQPVFDTGSGSINWYGRAVSLTMKIMRRLS